MNSGIIYDITRDQKQERYQEAVKRAHFLSESQKNNWGILGFTLTNDQLMEAERLILDEDLRRLATQEQLEKIKPQTNQHG